MQNETAIMGIHKKLVTVYGVYKYLLHDWAP
jgi:hypothetical protein